MVMHKPINEADSHRIACVVCDISLTVMSLGEALSDELSDMQRYNVFTCGGCIEMSSLPIDRPTPLSNLIRYEAELNAIGLALAKERA